MKTILSSRRNHYVIRVSAFLITAALIVGMIGCGGGGGVEYDLIIASNVGGSVTTPGEGTFTYDEVTVVNLVAEAEEGYRFVEWTGDVSNIVNVNAASTTITMNDNYSITASFVAQYTLTVDSTEGGEVIIPGEGMFTYDVGAVVELVAEAGEGYKFLNWTGDIDTVSDINTASTALTVEGDCAVTASFLPEHIYLDKIGPGLWGVYIFGEGVQVTVTDEGLLVNMASDSVDDPDSEPPQFAGGGYSQYVLKGDFDVQMGYELTTWIQGSGVRVGMIVGVPNLPGKTVSVERVGCGPDESLGQPSDVYLVNLEGSIPAIIGTEDQSGILRIRREGETLSCYYGTSTSLQELYQAEWFTEDVCITVAAWSHEDLFGGEEISVLLRTVEIVESAP